MSYTDKDLSKLIGEVEKEFTAHLAKAEELQVAALAKSETANAEATAQAATTTEVKVEATVEAPLVKAEKDEEKCDYDEKDHEDMHKMYSSMTKGERKAHAEAISKCGEMKMEKSEAVVEVKVETAPAQTDNKELELLKSEIEAQKAKSEGLQKNLDAVSEFLTKLVKKTAPQGKAITNLDSIAKSEVGSEEKTLSKSEVTAILAKKAADPSLKKSDRDAINSYYINGANINTVSHLLK